MFTITIETSFNASHQLTFADDTKEPLHDHSWIVRTAVSAEQLDKAGLAIDFIDLKAKIESITGPLQGCCLEEFEHFKTAGINASAENVAKYLYEMTEQLLPDRVQLLYTEVTEAVGCRAKYSK